LDGAADLVKRKAVIFRTGHLGTARLEAFSDGVLAIIVTLLVLEIKIPGGLSGDAAIWAALSHIAPGLFAWVVSFAFVLVFWVSHHYFVASLKSADRGLLWLNGLFLLCISSTPFPTGLVGEYPGATPPLALLSISMFATSLSFALMRFYATFHGRLTYEHVTPEQMRIAMAQSAIAPALYALAFMCAFVWKPGAIALQILVPLIFFLRSASHHGAATDDL
jgi:uncharacterized membrane protein